MGARHVQLLLRKRLHLLPPLPLDPLHIRHHRSPHVASWPFAQQELLADQGVMQNANPYLERLCIRVVASVLGVSVTCVQHMSPIGPSCCTMLHTLRYKVRSQNG